jgi:hypothetical protein
MILARNQRGKMGFWVAVNKLNFERAFRWSLASEKLCMRTCTVKDEFIVLKGINQKPIWFHMTIPFPSMLPL